MRIFVVVNRVREIGFRQTTALLIAALVRDGHDVWLLDVDAMSVEALGTSINVLGQACQVPASANCHCQQIESYVQSAPIHLRQKIQRDDLILIRTNPGRDVARMQIHESFLHLCVTAKSLGIRVVNAPEHLRFFASKSSLLVLEPSYRPAMVVTGNQQQAMEFVKSSPSDCVVKPLFGSRGENVIRVSRSCKNLKETIHTTFGASTLVVQQFVNANHVGDKRVIIVGGEILQSNGHFAGIERRPTDSDFRANLHAGGSAHPLRLSDSAVAATHHAAGILQQHGIWLAGVDLISDKIIEFNVFSTGGLFDSIEFSNIRFDEMIARKLVNCHHP